MEGELYEDAHKKENWVKYLLQHSHKKITNSTELESIINWTETTSIKKKNKRLF